MGNSQQRFVRTIRTPVDLSRKVMNPCNDIFWYLLPPGEAIEEYRNIVDATEDVQLPEEEVVLSSSTASETDLPYILHLLAH